MHGNVKWKDVESKANCFRGFTFTFSIIHGEKEKDGSILFLEDMLILFTFKQLCILPLTR